MHENNAAPGHRRSNSVSGQYYAASALLGAAPLELVSNHFRCDRVPRVSEAARGEEEPSRDEQACRNPLASPDAVRDYALAD